MKKMIFFFMGVLCVHFSNGQKLQDSPCDQEGYVRFHSPFSAIMLDQNRDLRKVNLLMKVRRDGLMDDSGLYLGASLIAIADYQRSNRDSK